MLKKILPGTETAGEKDREKHDLQILIIEDNLNFQKNLRNVIVEYLPLEIKEKTSFLFAENGEDAIEIMKKEPKLNLITLDMIMPGMDGYEAFERIRKSKALARHAEVPIFIVTNEGDDYVMKQLSHLMLTHDTILNKNNIDFTTSVLFKNELINQYKTFLSERQRDIAHADILNNINVISQFFSASHVAYHSARVQNATKLLSDSNVLGLNEAEKYVLNEMLVIHDKAKTIGIPAEILNKNGPLNEIESLIMDMHPIISYLLANSDYTNLFPFQAVAELLHHERNNGGGKIYGIPLRQLNNITIFYNQEYQTVRLNLLLSLIVLTDAMDAVISARPYKGKEKLNVFSREVIVNCYTQFSPLAVEAYFDKLVEIYQTKGVSAGRLELPALKFIRNGSLELIKLFNQSAVAQKIEQYMDQDLDPKRDNILVKTNQIREFIIKNIIEPNNLKLINENISIKNRQQLKNTYKTKMQEFITAKSAEYSIYILYFYYIGQGFAHCLLDLEDIQELEQKLLSKINETKFEQNRLKKITELQDAQLLIKLIATLVKAQSAEIAKREDLPYLEQKYQELEQIVKELKAELKKSRLAKDEHIQRTMQFFYEEITLLLGDLWRENGKIAGEYEKRVEEILKNTEDLFVELTGK